MTRVFIVDDHELMREGLKTVLNNEPHTQVVGEAGSYGELLTKMGKNIDVFVLDISLPDKNGLEVLKELKERYPRVPVMILSMHPEERFAVRAIKAGAAAYVNKQTAATELVKALEKVRKGGRYISTDLAERLMSELDHAPSLPHLVLSDREYEILRLIAMGKSARRIADDLSLSINTITTYRSRILEKMSMRTNAEIIRYALEHRLID